MSNPLDDSVLLPEPEESIFIPDLGLPLGSAWMSNQNFDDTGDPIADFAKRVDVAASRPEEWSDASKQAADAIRAALASREVSEVHGLGPDALFVKHQGSHARVKTTFSSERDYNAFIRGLVDEAETTSTWSDLKTNYRGVLRMADGSSLTVVLPPFTPTVHFTVRKHNLLQWQAQDLIANQTMTPAMMQFLRACAAARVNILLVGQVGSGKTSVLSILTQEFGDNERIALVEEVPEIWIAKPQVASYTYQPIDPALGLREILDSSLYMRFDRVIVGEIHDRGLAKMLEVMLLSDGSMSTYHAGSVEQMVERMKIALQMENPQMTAETALSMMRNSVELVVVLGRVNGRHRCLQIAELDWRASGEGERSTRLGRNLLWEWSFTENRHVSAGRLDAGGRVYEKGLRYNVRFNPDWFIDAADLEQLRRARG